MAANMVAVGILIAVVGNLGIIARLVVDAQGRVYVAGSETNQIVRCVP